MKRMGLCHEDFWVGEVECSHSCYTHLPRSARLSSRSEIIKADTAFYEQVYSTAMLTRDGKMPPANGWATIDTHGLGLQRKSQTVIELPTFLTYLEVNSTSSTISVECETAAIDHA